MEFLNPNQGKHFPSDQESESWELWGHSGTAEGSVSVVYTAESLFSSKTYFRFHNAKYSKVYLEFLLILISMGQWDSSVSKDP